MSANPVANGGLLRKPLDMPDFRTLGVEVKKPGTTQVGNAGFLGALMREVMRLNKDNFRLFGPDESQSNRLDAVYEVTDKAWLGEYFPEDADGGHLAPDGRVMEMLSEHTLEGWLEGYILSGRHGLINSYESFVHVIDSMVNQHAKWLEKCNELPWRMKVSSLNILISGLVWRQDHNGFTHQDPGFLDVVANKSPSVVRIYLPPDANCLLSVGDHCFRSQNYINVIVADKQPQDMQYLDMEAAIAHCTKGLGIWNWASNDQGTEPDVVLASCGDVPTLECLAAAALLRQHIPDVKVRVVNVVDLFKLLPSSRAPPRPVGPRFRGRLHGGQAGGLHLSRLPGADPPAHLPPAESTQPPRARLQGARQHQHAAGAGHPQPDGPVHAGHGRHRPHPPLARQRGRRPR